jgi:hypothetical protein
VYCLYFLVAGLPARDCCLHFLVTGLPARGCCLYFLVTGLHAEVLSIFSCCRPACKRCCLYFFVAGLVARGHGTSLPGPIQKTEGLKGQATQDSEEQENKIRFKMMCGYYVVSPRADLRDINS